MVHDGMSIEITESDRLFRPGLKEVVKVFYGYGAAWLLRKGLLILNDIRILGFEILQDLTVLFRFPRLVLLLFNVPKLHWLLWCRAFMYTIQHISSSWFHSDASTRNLLMISTS